MGKGGFFLFFIPDENLARRPPRPPPRLPPPFVSFRASLAAHHRLKTPLSAPLGLGEERKIRKPQKALDLLPPLEFLANSSSSSSSSSSEVVCACDRQPTTEKQTQSVGAAQATLISLSLLVYIRIPGSFVSLPACSPPPPPEAGSCEGGREGGKDHKIL